MAMLFKRPRMGATTTPDVPSESGADVQSAADEQRRRMMQATKTQSWLTGGTGVQRSTNMYAASKVLAGT